MKDEFKLWSELNTEAKMQLKPDLGLRSWDNLTKVEKETFLHHFYKISGLTPSNIDIPHSNIIPNQLCVELRIFKAVSQMQKENKYNNYFPNFLKNHSSNIAIDEFRSCILIHKENVVLQLISFLFKTILNELGDKTLKQMKERLPEKEFFEWKWRVFDKVSSELNETFEAFGVKYFMTRQGFIEKQDEKITKEIYEPVLKILSEEKWQEVSGILVKAFFAYRERNHELAITHSISAIEAFLQILIEGKTGGSKYNPLIKELIKKNPEDKFIEIIFKNLDAYFARERQDGSILHPQQVKPTEKNSRLLLNLIMIFIQHCLQK